jgi:hypothetical protein
MIEMKKWIWISFFALTTTALAQIWVKVASESPTLSLTLPTGTTYRMGNSADNRWSLNQAVSTQLMMPVYYPIMSVAFQDPDPGRLKEVDILETAAMQTVTLSDTSISPMKVTVINIPPLTPVAPASYPPIIFTAGTVYPLAFTNISVIPNSPAAALFDLVPIPGWEFYAALLQNFTSTFSIGGVIFNCTYVSATTNGKVNVNCVAAPITAQ